MTAKPNGTARSIAGSKDPSVEERKLVDQAKAEMLVANEVEERNAPVPERERLYWSVASIWFAAAVAAQNRFRFLVWGEYMNRAKTWARKALGAEIETTASKTLADAPRFFRMPTGTR
jgi:hypothetical protein